MTSRRDFLIGGACAAAAGAGWWRTPRNHLSLLGKNKLENVLPIAFGDWHEIPSDALVVPQSKDSLAGKLYNQSLGRIYQKADGRVVMLLIAYGSTQSDQLQLHRPEVCYPAVGFNVVQSAATAIPVAPSVAIPGRILTAQSPVRTEHISYWTRIGEFLPQDGAAQQLAKLKCALDGLIPDGVLLRISNVETEARQGFALNQKFAADMLAATLPAARPALIGSANARAFKA